MNTAYDIIFIGSGPAGYVGAIKSAQLGMRTACVEKDKAPGGTCLNVGCIPSKALLHTSELVDQMKRHGREMGVDADGVRVDVGRMMAHKEKVVDKLTGGVRYLFKKNKVDFIQGTAKFSSKNSISVNGTNYTAKHIVIATGSEPIALPFLPFDEKRIVSSTGALALQKIPKSMAIIGAGVIGLELGSVYARLGTKIEVFELLDRIIPEFDADLSKAFQKTLEGQGFKFNLQYTVTPETKFDTEIILVAIGRKPYTKDLGLDVAGIQTDKKGFIQIDGGFRTTAPGIYAIGDASGPPCLAHKGMEEALCLVENLTGHSVKMNYVAIPNVIYTSPEVASVGFTENDLKHRGVPYKMSNFPFIGNSRYQAIGGVEPCFVKALSHATTGHLLGCHILAPGASEMIAEPTLAIQAGLKIDTLAESCKAHPTFSEGLHEAYLGLTSKFLHL